jgi:RimJ/RimL family protein N-acetyltransferase
MPRTKDNKAPAIPCAAAIPLAGQSPEAPCVTLEAPSAEAHGCEIRDVTSDMTMMRWIAAGTTWTPCRLRAFFRYCSKEEKQHHGVRKNYFDAVVLDGVCVGIVGIHPATYDRTLRGTPTLTIILSAGASGRGVGTRTVQMALASFWEKRPKKTVAIDVNSANFPMLRVAEKLGLSRACTLKIGKNDYDRFLAVDIRR